MQQFSAPARLVALLLLTAGAAFSTHIFALALLFTAVMAAALLSYLPIPSILGMLALPLLLLAAPSWIAAMAFFKVPAAAAAVALLRVATCTATGVVLAHSIGLNRLAAAMRALGLPAELAAAVHASIAQAFLFSDLSTEMEQARHARMIHPPPAGLMRRLAGGQTAILLARMMQRSRALAMATDARTLRAGRTVDSPADSWAWKDAAFVGAAAIVAFIVALL